MPPIAVVVDEAVCYARSVFHARLLGTQVYKPAFLDAEQLSELDNLAMQMASAMNHQCMPHH